MNIGYFTDGHGRRELWLPLFLIIFLVILIPRLTPAAATSANLRQVPGIHVPPHLSSGLHVIHKGADSGWGLIQILYPEEIQHPPNSIIS
jgi:hypothetical protein